MTVPHEGKNYGYWHARGNPSHAYLLPVVERVVCTFSSSPRVIDIGSGNGFVAGRLSDLGCEVVGVEPSDQGIERARERFPQISFHQMSCYDDLAGHFGQFDLVTCLEVIEHLYEPRQLATTISALLKPQGVAVISTSYHGFLKYLALAATGRMSRHMNPLHEGGHIKFFTPKQLTECLGSAGLSVDHIERVGRVPALAKSMIAVARQTNPAVRHPQ